MQLIISTAPVSNQGSGLYLFDGNAITLIDALPSGGITRTNDLIYRMLSLRQGDGAEILVYDRTGIIRYQRCPAVSDPHDLLALDDGSVVAVSTHDNAIVEVRRDGSVRDVFRADAPFDAWHLNCVTQHDGRLYATAFGRFNSHRGWQGKWHGAGMLFDVASGEDVLGGLTAPHSPRRFGDAWLLCDSGTETVVRCRDGSAALERVDVGGFSRGLCIADGRAYVGVSRMRDGALMPGTGWISVVDVDTWREVERIPLPCDSIYDVLEIDESLLDGLRVGFRFGSRRERYLGQLAMFEQVGVSPRRVWGFGDRLERDECRVRLDAVLPQRLALGQVVSLEVTVQNLGAGLFVPAPPYPVDVCYRWFDEDGNAVGAGQWLHTPLPRVLPPSERVTLRVLVAAPPVTGRFTLRLTLLQEGVQWFDDISADNAITSVVDVEAVAE